MKTLVLLPSLFIALLVSNTAFAAANKGFSASATLSTKAISESLYAEAVSNSLSAGAATSDAMQSTKAISESLYAEAVSASLAAGAESAGAESAEAISAETYAAAHTAVATATNAASLPVVRFFHSDTIVVVSPQQCQLTATDKADLEKVVFWDDTQARPVYIYKSESELTKKDKRRHLLFIGCLHQFQRREFFNIPVTKVTKGFRIGDNQFDRASDTFFYINARANRMYLCKNTPDARHAFFAIGGTPFPLHVFSDNRLVLTGYNQ